MHLRFLLSASPLWSSCSFHRRSIFPRSSVFVGARGMSAQSNTLNESCVPLISSTGKSPPLHTHTHTPSCTQTGVCAHTHTHTQALLYMRSFPFCVFRDVSGPDVSLHSEQTAAVSFSHSWKSFSSARVSTTCVLLFFKMIYLF